MVPLPNFAPTTVSKLPIVWKQPSVSPPAARYGQVLLVVQVGVQVGIGNQVTGPAGYPHAQQPWVLHRLAGAVDPGVDGEEEVVRVVKVVPGTDLGARKPAELTARIGLPGRLVGVNFPQYADSPQ